ncbi:hypothetical protein [Pseudofrankia sp. DC12]|uniref:hypothetical protein n=1 Tax=Pseudofrankia sp. DC12 TaxID=683315 RepID=UPI0005F771F9|nr:hypothetical protein [Pseudofrankia sp. DC12]
MANLHEDYDKLQTAFIGLVVAVLGVGLLVLAKNLHLFPRLAWLNFFPVSEIGGILFSFGLLGIGLDYVQRRSASRLQSEQLRQIITEEAPALRDAVIRGFAFDQADLARVATPDMLDEILRNSLALRLGDVTFARELYGDIRDLAIASTERWHDARVELTLSPLTMVRGTPSGSASPATRTPMFALTARWEYTTIPASPMRRFVCVSDRQEYRDLSQEAGPTSAWWFRPVDDLHGGSPEAFELAQFTVDGKERPIRRSARDGSQTYSVSVGKAAVEAGEPVVISYTYRTLVRQDGRLIKIDVEQPTRGLTVQLDYRDAAVQDVRLLDFFASTNRARISEAPEAVPEQTIRAEFDGWVLPRSGVVLAWELDDLKQNRK